MKMKKPEIIFLLFIIVCLAFPLFSIGQPATLDPEDTPIDGGLSILLAAGAAYGVKKYRDHKKKDQEVQK